MKRLSTLLILVFLAIGMFTFTGCTVSGQQAERQRTMQVGNSLIDRQPTPTDIDYSLERHNLIRRAYWVNGQRDRARTLPSPIADMPLGYVVLFTDGGGIIGRFIVEGKITSLNSFLAPYSESYMTSSLSRWLPDVDGAFGENDAGIFFFTPDGRYIEFNGTYLYSDIPFEIDDPIVRIGS
jgi:hypothetical protein